MNTVPTPSAAPSETARNGDAAPAEKPAPVATSTAMVVRAQDDSFRMALEPTGFKEAQTIAAMVTAIQLCGITKPEDAMVRIMTGRALGLPTFAALRSVFNIEGRPSLEAKLKVALAERLPDCEYIECIETTTKIATYVAKKRGRPERKLSFTIEEAVAAGLLDRGATPEAKKMNNWNRYPAAMLRARAQSQIVDMVFPGACLGLPSREELDDGEYRHDPNELVGEVVHPVPVQPPPQAAPARDFERESEALALRISAAIDSKNRETVKQVRVEMEKFIAEAGEPWGSSIRDHYNRRLELAKAATAPAPTQKTDDLPFK